jgi:RNA-directed DNA polymerase
MGLFDWLRRLFGGTKKQPGSPAEPQPRREPSRYVRRPRRPRVKLAPLKHHPPFSSNPRTGETSARVPQGGGSISGVRIPAVPQRPYRFARPAIEGGWLDLSRDQDESRLERYDLPRFRNPEELAGWLDIPLGQLAWLVHRFHEDQRPADESTAHYSFRWIKKRSGGNRLIEAPKSKLKRVQRQILGEILNHVPTHPAAHGFVAGRSIRTNAAPHVGHLVLVKLDLENFYPSVSLNRVTAIFRSLWYSREAAIWLGRLTTSALPASFVRQGHPHADFKPYLGRRLPQGAPTSPALANLSAFPLDLRLSGMARSFGAQYTRYADDLTFSGDEQFLRSLAVFLPLVSQIVRAERFVLNKSKRRIIRSSQRQTVTGVVVNSRPNIARRDFDAIKAILTNCIRRGPSTQNHDRHEQFAAHLLGRIAHVTQLNPARGQKLHELYSQIDWNR